MAEFEVLGTRYPLAFTIRVVEKVCERYGSLEDFDNLAKERTDIELLKEYIWVLREMMLGAAAKISMEKAATSQTSQTWSVFTMFWNGGAIRAS